ncbi:MAG: sulfide dehydrogenase (flavoprotein) subunit SudB [Haloplasmataceae bacterium]|jgi:ferredoxin--NADP+ reductase|nr:sulfide dehydrogenase (flavoprotein) subunit SudB [Haloplasmataceae bacterium]
MNVILKKAQLNQHTVLYELEAPYIAKKANAGQFIILRINEFGERIPLTIADYNRDLGTITIIFQTVGKTTLDLARLNVGDSIQDVVGPLGTSSHFEKVKKVIVIGGGVGCAIAYPQAKTLFKCGIDIDIVAGFRTHELIILEDEMRQVCNRLFICTDDGSYKEKGLVTDILKRLLDEEKNYDLVIAIGPLVMMKYICKLTELYHIKTIVSLNPVMVDGTGMCGGCRVRVDGKIKFACVDGPDFDGLLVDFDELINRNNFYKEEEKHMCKLFGGK